MVFSESVWTNECDTLEKINLAEGKVSYNIVKNTMQSCHKNHCVMKDKDGNCPKICDILKQLDKKKKDPKRLHWSLKLKRK